MKTTEEILQENGLDFTISKLPMVAIQDSEVITEVLNALSSDPNTIELANRLSNSIDSTPYFGLKNDKSENYINSVKESYTISQNKEVVDMVLKGMKPFGDDLKVHKAGSLNDGRKVFMQLAINGESKVGNDTIKKYVTIIDSNDGSTGLSVGIGDLTMSCQNQFFQFYKAGEHKFRHTASIEERIKTIPMLIKTALSESMKLIEVYNKMASTKVSKDLADKLVNHLIGVDRTMPEEELNLLKTRKMNIMNSLYNHIQKETKDKGWNLWGLHSGVTSWTTHEKSHPQRENGQIESIMIGTNYKTNQDSLQFALANL